MTGSATGFTLVELMLAMAISAGVAVTAAASMTMLTDADAEATLRIEETSGVERALRGVRSDVENATQISISGPTLYLTMRDSSIVAYPVVASGTELQRLTGSSLLVVTTLVTSLLSTTMPQPEFTDRGILRDAYYHSAAVLQGVRAIRMATINRSGTVLGVAIEVDCGIGDSSDTTRCLAMSLPLMEAFAKP